MTDETTASNEMIAREGNDASAAQAGRSWADAVRLQLHEMGRRASGGWPGTVSEARERLGYAIGPTTPLSSAERTRLTRVLYSAAKQYWHLNREPHAPEE